MTLEQRPHQDRLSSKEKFINFLGRKIGRPVTERQVKLFVTIIVAIIVAIMVILNIVVPIIIHRDYVPAFQ